MGGSWPTKQHPDDNVFDVIRKAFDRCNREQCTLLALVCWSLWNRRNKWVWERINRSAFGVKAAALNLLTEWKKAQEQQMTSGTSGTAPVAIRKWVRSQTQWVKVNVDAALFEDIECIGLRGIVRGADGQFIMAKSIRQEGLIRSREAEALCLKEILAWLKDKGFAKCDFESDSQVLVRACKGTYGRSYFDTIVRDCIDLFQHFEEVLVRFAYRSANGAGHASARAAYSTSGSRK